MALRILTVCIGNQCRSPLAERLLQARLDALAPGLAVVTSAGTGARDGTPMDAQAAAELRRLGGDPSGATARRLTPELLADQDLVLAATRDLRTASVRLAPRTMKRSFTITELAAILGTSDLPHDLHPDELVAVAATRRQAGADAPDLADPIGASDSVHREVADRIDAAVSAIARRLAAGAA